MRHTFIGGAAVLLALGIAAPVQAKDRKGSASGDRQSVAEMISAPRASAAASIDSSAGKPNGKPTPPLAEQQLAPSNPFSLKLGAVTVRPAVGGIKGARFSFEF